MQPAERYSGGWLLAFVAACTGVGLAAAFVQRGRGKPYRSPSPPPLPPNPFAVPPRPSGGVHSSPMAPDSISASHPTLAQWGVAVTPGCLLAGVQVPYALKWGDMESGGNPCAIGYPAAHGPDGNPLELGFGQFYNPDDLRLVPGTTGAQLRAYCVPGDQHEINYRGKIIKGFSQAMTRPLSDAELAQQAALLVALIRRSMHSATADLMANGVPWSSTSRDYWALVKLQHGLPALSREGLPAVVHALGRSPTSFAEFRHTIESGAAKISPENDAKYRGDFARIFDNAEECASAFQELANA